MRVLAQVRWLKPEEGGRTAPPHGQQYSTVAKFDLQTEDEWRKDAWSLILNPMGVPDEAEQIRNYSAAAQPVLDELRGLDYRLEALGDLRHQGKPWKSALPVLLRWLPIVDDPGVKEDIVRCLSVPWVGNTATAQLIN